MATVVLTLTSSALAQVAPLAPPEVLMTDPPHVDEAPVAPSEPVRVATDRFFPGGGHVSLSAASGVPFAGIGEVAVGLSDGFTASVIGGVADPNPQVEYAVGGRIEASVFRAHDVGMLLTLPILYYPPSAKRDGDAWMLTNPALLVQGNVPWAGLHVYGGVGGLAASCTSDLLAHFGAGAKTPARDRAPMVDGAWNTFHLGASIPTSRSTTLFFDGTLIMSGLAISESYSQKVGTPAVAELGWSVRL